MLWHGSSNKSNSILNHRYQKQKNSKHLNMYQFKINQKNKSNQYLLTYTLPNTWHTLILHNTTRCKYQLLIYSNTYFLRLPLISKNSTLRFDKITNQIVINTAFINSYNILYKTVMYNFYRIFIKPIFSKLKFKGKGYYIYKNYRNTITPQFGYSHRLYLYAFFLHVTFLSKTSLLIFGLNQQQLSISSKLFYSWRPLNIFTGRGVRFSQQLVYKKSGKVSSYR